VQAHRVKMAEKWMVNEREDNDIKEMRTRECIYFCREILGSQVGK